MSLDIPVQNTPNTLLSARESHFHADFERRKARGYSEFETYKDKPLKNFTKNGYSRFYNQKNLKPLQTDDQGILIPSQQVKPNLNSHERELDYYNDKFKELMSWAGKPNWDNEGADRVEIKTYKFAMKIVGKIIKKVTYNPEIAPDPDGRIDFNWHLDDGTMFTISVGNKRDLVISGLRYGKSELSGMQVWEIEGKNYSLLECGLDWFNEVQGE